MLKTIKTFALLLLLNSAICVKEQVEKDLFDFAFDFKDIHSETEEKDWKKCQHPSDIRNGKTKVWGDGLLLEFQCIKGFFAVGITHGACDVTSGKWTINPPVCVASGCPHITAPRHGVVTIQHNGGVAEITCRPGYYLVGSSFLICENKKWTGIFPFCAVNAKVRKEVGRNIKVNEKDINLQTADETCFQQHIEPPTIPNAIMTTSYVFSKYISRYIMVAIYTCVGGYKLANKYANKLYCSNSIWSAIVTPMCKRDNDPCQNSNGGCAHICIPKKNRFACSCNTGYTLGPDYRSCQDINECLLENGGCEQDCINTDGSYSCACGPGFMANGATCIDIDECSNTHLNECPGPCMNSAGSYKCNCSITGYQPSTADHFCKDVDECSVNNGGCDDVCINRRGSYECRCEKQGWLLGTDNHHCVDVNECERYGENLCRHGSCVNMEGRFRCDCNTGFQPGKHGAFCKDADECKVDNGGCEHGCENTFGSFVCYCDQDAYTLANDKIHCEDRDECQEGLDECEDICVNTPGSYRCECSQVGKEIDVNNRTCTDCRSNHYYKKSDRQCHPCPPNSEITESNGRNIAMSVDNCQCADGFTGDPSRNIPCTDIDECSGNQLGCLYGCENFEGYAKCSCPDGYSSEIDGVICRDVDECQNNTGGCNHRCINTDGSFYCQCDGPGYYMMDNRLTCVDINECSDPNYCSHGCENFDGGAVCTCAIGYHLDKDKKGCIDTDECAVGTAPCEQVCLNTIGSFECFCEGNGFKLSLDQKTCIDINECMEGESICHEECVNTRGSYVCRCETRGFQTGPDGVSCVDRDECEEYNGTLCDHICVNIPGSYRCECRSGYKLKGTSCSACPAGYFRGDLDRKCERCPFFSVTNGTAKTSVGDCFCRLGYWGDPGRNITCVDVDECQGNAYGCSFKCVNTEGSAYCTCETGYKLDKDKRTCKDINECIDGTHRCQQTCNNTDGGYTCGCESTKFVLGKDGHSCDDIDECQMDFGCSYKCVNTRGSAYCMCEPGFRLLQDNKTCIDHDECQEDNGGCIQGCKNIAGSFECFCTVVGFEVYHLDKTMCVDVNECYRGNPCEDHCINNYGSFKCQCLKKGYILSSDGHSCQDINECVTPGICNGTKCVNLPGTYRCKCPPGKFRQSGRCIECPVGTYRNSSHTGALCEHCPANSRSVHRGSTNVGSCVCIKGYVGDPAKGIQCIDYNECSSNNGGCTHTCNNYAGGFSCSCKQTYTLLPDMKTCRKKFCDPLKKVQFGRLWPWACHSGSSNRLTKGTVCSYRCSRGYQLTGERYRVCQENGTWSGTEVSCVPKTCEGLHQPNHGRLHPISCLSDKVPFHTRCTYVCNPGFRLIGRKATKCRANQQWSIPTQPKCVPFPKNIPRRSKRKMT